MSGSKLLNFYPELKRSEEYLVSTLGQIKSGYIRKWNWYIPLFTFWNSKEILCMPLATDNRPLHVGLLVHNLFSPASQQFRSPPTTKFISSQALQKRLSLCHNFLSLEHYVILCPNTKIRVLGSLLFSIHIFSSAKVLTMATLESLGSFKKSSGWEPPPRGTDLVGLDMTWYQGS